jgi:enterochelin esterase-like enzyme
MSTKNRVLSVSMIISILLLTSCFSLFGGDVIPVLSGKVVEGNVFKSDLVAEDVNYSIYLPPDYDFSSRSYPVLYLLHGYSDDETAWVQFGEVNVSADKMINSGEIPALIIVMPDARITYYVDDIAGKDKYATMFAEEFVPYIENTYRIRAKKEFRAVSGLSMGGYGSLIYALRYPDMFASCAAFSAAVRDDQRILNMEQEAWDRRYGKIFGEGLAGEGRLTDHWKSFSVMYKAENLPLETLKSVRWYIDCGDEDGLGVGNSALHFLWMNREVPHEYRVRDGAHRWIYWRTGIRDGLRFIGDGFNR